MSAIQELDIVAGATIFARQARTWPGYLALLESHLARMGVR